MLVRNRLIFHKCIDWFLQTQISGNTQVGIFFGEIVWDDLFLLARQYWCKQYIKIVLTNNFVYERLQKFSVDFNSKTITFEEKRFEVLRKIEPHRPFLHLRKHSEGILEVSFNIDASQIWLENLFVEIESRDKPDSNFELVISHQDVYYNVRSYKLQPITDQAISSSN